MPQAEPAVLLVGAGAAMEAALTKALDRHGVFVEAASAGAVVDAVVAAAPDLILLVGDAARDCGSEVLAELAASPLSSVVPVAILDDNTALDARLRAFRHGAAAIIPYSASADAIADQVARLAREIPERDGGSLGNLGESTLEDLINALGKELRSGVLSVRSEQDSEAEAVRLVLGGGQPLTEVIDEFVSRLRGHIVLAEPLRYEFDERAAGTVQLLGGDSDEARAQREDVHGLRILLADDDAARADAVAQQLRSHETTVVVTDLDPSAMRFERLRQVDPTVLLIGEEQLQGMGYELIRRMRRDTRLRWASLLVVRWNEVWGESARVPAVDRLLGTFHDLAEPERAVSARADEGEPFDTRLESMGPTRLLRALTACSHPIRLTVFNPRVQVTIEISNELIVSASAHILGTRLEQLEGASALSAYAVLGSGRAHIETVEQPSSTNVMSTIDVALNMADAEPPPIPPSLPSPAGDSVRPPIAGALAAGRASAQQSVHPAPARVPAMPAAAPVPVPAAVPAAPALAPPNADAAPASLAPESLSPESLIPLSVPPESMDPASVAPGSLRPASLSPDSGGPVSVDAVLLEAPSVPPAGIPPLAAPELYASPELDIPLRRKPRRGLVAAIVLGVFTLVGLGALGVHFLTGTREASPQHATSASAPAKSAGAAKTAAAAAASATPTQSAAPAESAAAPSTSASAGSPSAAGTPAKADDSGGTPPSRHAKLPVIRHARAPSCKQLLAKEPPRRDGHPGAAYRAILDARRGLVRGDLDAAQRSYCRAIRFDKRSIAAVVELTRVFLLRRDGVAAAHWAYIAGKRGADPTTVQGLMGDAYALAGSFDKARAAWLQANGSRPGDARDEEKLADKSFTIGRAALRASAYARAERYFRRAIVLAPDNVNAAIRLAKTLLLLDVPGDALTWISFAVAESPGNASARVTLGDVLHRKGRDDEARGAWKKALELQPGNLAAQARLSRLTSR